MNIISKDTLNLSKIVIHSCLWTDMKIIISVQRQKICFQNSNHLKIILGINVVYLLVNILSLIGCFGKSMVKVKLELSGVFLRFNKNPGHYGKMSSKIYDKLKLDFSANQSKLMKGKSKSKDHAIKLKNNLTNLNQSIDQRARVKLRMTGHIVSEDQRSKIGIGVSNFVKNTIWINNGISNKRILKSEIIPIGWIRGRGKVNF